MQQKSQKARAQFKIWDICAQYPSKNRIFYPLFGNNRRMKKSDIKNIEQQLLDAAVKERAKKPKLSKREEASNVIVGAASKLACKSAQLVARLKADRQIVVVCFGTSAISGDSLGPMVGSRLVERYNVPAFVYGTEQHSVNGKNMSEWLRFIRAVHGDALYIAVDASLGQKERVGQLILRDDGVCPAAIKGKKERFGDIGILAVVAENAGDSLTQLMSVSQVYVSKLADEASLLVKTAILGA